MKEDAIGPEIHAGALSSQNAVKALLNSSQGHLNLFLAVAVPVHKLKPGHFKREVAL